MNNLKNYNLKHRAFVILGLLAESPMGDHAYNINKKIDDRGMRNWTNIGANISLSTIYRILERLKNDKLVESVMKKVENRERKVYKLSSKGDLILKHKVMYVLSEFYGKKDEDFYVAFSMFRNLSKEEQIGAFTNSINKMIIHKKELEKMLKENSKYPINVTGLFKHPIMILEADIKFLEWVLIKVQERE